MFTFRSLLRWPFVLRSTFDAERARVIELCDNVHALSERISGLVEYSSKLVVARDKIAEQNSHLEDKLNSALNSAVELSNKLSVAERQAKSLRTAKAVWDVLTTLDNTLETHMKSVRDVIRDSKSRIGGAYEIATDPSPPGRIPRPSNS